MAADAGESERKAAAAMASAAAAKLYFLIRKYQLGRSDGEKLCRIRTVYQIPQNYTALCYLSVSSENKLLIKIKLAYCRLILSLKTV